MVDVVYRFGTGDGASDRRPDTPGQARALLEQGNREFSSLFEPGAAQDTPLMVTVAAGGLGLRSAGGIEDHAPFAAVLGCADARVPIELLFGRAVNDLFVLRVGGNVLGTDVLGSLDYAMQHLPSLRLVVVLGHTTCGAMGAAVEAYLNPAGYLGLGAEHQLRRIVDQLFPAIRLSHAELVDIHGPAAQRQGGFVPALVDVAVAVNAAIMATTLRGELAQYGRGEMESSYAVYDLVTHRVGMPLAESPGRPRMGLFDPPGDAASFTRLARELASGDKVRALLDA